MNFFYLGLNIIIKLKYNFTFEDNDFKNSLKNVKKPVFLICAQNDSLINSNNTVNLFKNANKDFVKYWKRNVWFK